MELSKLRVLLLDDESASMQYSKTAIAAFVQEDHIYCAASASAAMDVLENQKIDLAFLDIEIPGTDGFSVAEFVRSRYPDVKVVFLTGHVELGAKSFDYEPFDFLGKPVDIMRLRKTLDRFMKIQPSAPKQPEMIALETGEGLVMLNVNEIDYIVKENRKTVIHCKAQEYTVKYSLDELEAIFSENDLFRTHQSYLVPLNRIVSVRQASFGKTYVAVLPDGTKIPMSRIQYGKLRGRLSAKGIRIL